jgi:hypothetical protein
MGCLEYKKNVNSQNGEDGIIEYIFDKLNIKEGNFIEFGAWDGKHLSNCLNLVDKGWTGIYIEGDSLKYRDLQENFGSNERITCVLDYVSFKDSNNLDCIIERSGHKNLEFDFLSIDVDGLDYNIFEDLKRNLPKVVCIEVNAGHSPIYENIIPQEISKNNIGQSIKVISDLARQKGYFPLCYTGNLFLISKEYENIFSEDIKDIKSIYIDFLNHLNESEIFYLYEIFVIGKEKNFPYFQNEVLENFWTNKNILC